MSIYTDGYGATDEDFSSIEPYWDREEEKQARVIWRRPEWVIIDGRTYVVG